MMRSAAITIVLLTSACSLVHPVHVTAPSAPHAFATSSDAADDTPHASGPAERLTKNEVWWSAFHDPALDAAIQEAFKNNLVTRDVRGLIYENQVDPVVPQGWWWPLQIGVLTPATVQHVKVYIPPGGPNATVGYNRQAINLSATYQVDLWGNIDAQRRAGLNFAEQQRQNVENQVQNLAMQIGQAWFDILETRALRDLTLTQIKYNQELYKLVNARFEQHLTPRLVVLQQEQLLVNLQSQVPLITARLALLNSQLHQYLGRMPRPADDIVPLERQLPNLPPAPSIGTPSELDANTPEMRLAHLRLEEVQHRINANLSSWLPAVQLVGTIGTSRTDPKEGFVKEYAAAVTMTWIMFDGRRITEARQLQIQLKRREAQYELALQTAVGRVQDAVVRETSQATSLQSLRSQVELGRQLLAEARQLFEQGQSDYLPVLTALNNQVDLERAGLQAQRLLLNYRVELYRALGGNWSYDVTLFRE